MGQAVWNYNGWFSGNDRRAQRNSIYGMRECRKAEGRLSNCTASSIKKNTVVKTVNIILARGLYHRQFQAFVSDLDAECWDLPYHSEVRWPSCGSVLQRFHTLRSNIDQVLKEKG